MKNLFRKIFGLAGLEVHKKGSLKLVRERDKANSAIEPWRRLSRYNPNTLLDIGANDGYSVKLFRQIFPNVRILSFEPLADCFLKTQKTIRDHPPGEAYHCALGDVDRISVIHRSEFSPSSSLLPMDELHKQEFPFTSNSTEEQISVRTLDGLYDELDLKQPIIAKIDVQGFEDRVIRGAQRTLRETDAIVVELSTYKLYQGQSTFSDVHSQLEELGFIFRGTVEQMISSIDGRILQFDALFDRGCG